MVLVFMQVVTGLLLLFVYSPEMSKAYDSIRILQNEVVFGKLIRNLHHWGANFLIIIIFLHMLRVFFTGAYGDKRKINWWVGLSLFLCILISNFTGYLLPFDQLSYWAITICIGMFDYIPFAGSHIREVIIGGNDITQSTLSNFYAAHIALIPITLAFLLPFHFWRVRKAGGVVLPFHPDKNNSDALEKVSSVPNLVTREITAALVTIATLLFFSILFDAPLAGSANPGMSPNPTKAPWYFSGLQELLQHFHPTFAVFVIPLFFSVLLVGLPYLKEKNGTDGFWLISSKGKKTGLVSAICALIVVPLVIVLNETVFHTSSFFPELPLIITNGLMPFIFVLAFITGMYVWFSKYFAASRSESLQAVCIFLLVSLVVLTIIGMWFRGQGMALCWPWEMTISEIALIK
jgi:quinol-cytochrome oxidoreductase complex cytochrome b subunit